MNCVEGGAASGDRRQWLLAIVIAAALTVLLQVPYVLGYLTAPADTFYTGLMVNVEDANYITIIERGREGAWTHSLRFTSEPDVPAFLYVFYLAWGHLARVLNTDATTMWHAARAVMTFVTCLVAFGFIGTFIEQRSWRMVAYLLAIFGAGSDWVALPWEMVTPTSATPADLRMPDAHFFYAALTFPHYLGSIACLLVLFWCAVRLVTEPLGRAKFSALFFLGALANLGVALVYPFFVILSCAVLGLYVLLVMARARKILWREGFIVGGLILAVVPVSVYYANALASSELLRVWSAQSQTLSPNPLHYVLTFAPYLILALLDLWRVGPGDNKRLLLWVWVAVVAVLVYAPLGAQRRFLQGVQIPLAILATLGLFEVVLPRVQQAGWFQALARRPNYSVAGVSRLLVVLLVLVVSISSVYQWASAIALTMLQQPYPLFRPRGEIAAMDWLRQNADRSDVVLSAYMSGSYLPYRSGTRAYLGHLYETIHFDEKEKQVARFFDAAATDGERIALLRDNGIRYLFYGRAERALGAFEPDRAEFLDKQFENSDAAIYLVR